MTAKNIFKKEKIWARPICRRDGLQKRRLRLRPLDGHPLGARFDVPHGVANALLLPIVMEFNLPAAKEKYGDIARAMGVDTAGMSIDEAAHAAVEAVR